MRLIIPICLLVAGGIAGWVTAGIAIDRAHEAINHQPSTIKQSWSVEVLRTSDARGMTYSSLHTTQQEPEAQGTVLRWTDEHGRRWLFVEGALAHEVKEDQ